MNQRMCTMRSLWIVCSICLSSIILLLVVSSPASSEWADYWGDPGNVNSVDGFGELSQGVVRYSYVNETLWLPPLVCDVFGDAHPEILRFHYTTAMNPDVAWIEVLGHDNEELRYKITLGLNNVPSQTSGDDAVITADAGGDEDQTVFQIGARSKQLVEAVKANVR